MFRRLFWLSAIAGVGYAIWRLVRQQNEASAPAADAGRLYTPPTAESGPRPATLAPSGVADAAVPATGPRRIPTRVHRGSPPATPPPAEPADAEPEAADAEPEAADAAEPPALPETPDLAGLVSSAADAADDLSELVGAAVAGEQVLDLAPLVGPEAGGTPLTNVNTADEAALIALPGIGPALARRIIAYREEHGPFASVDQLDVIQGIGPRNIDEFRHLVTV
jgi:competence protein ComEA